MLDDRDGNDIADMIAFVISRTKTDADYQLVVWLLEIALLEIMDVLTVRDSENEKII